MKLSKKLSGGFSLILVILVFTSGFALYSFSQTDTQVRSIGTETIPNLLNSEELSAEALIALNKEKDFLLSKNSQERSNAILELNKVSKVLKTKVNETFANSDEGKINELSGKITTFENLYTTLADQLTKIDQLNAQLYTTNNELVLTLSKYSDMRKERFALQQSAMLAINTFKTLYKGMKVTTSQLLNNPTIDKKEMLGKARREQMNLRSSTTKFSAYLVKDSDTELSKNLKLQIKGFSKLLKQFVTAYTKFPDDKKKHEEAKAAVVKAEETISDMVDALFETKENDIGTSKTALAKISQLAYLLPETQIQNLGYQISQNEDNLKKSLDTAAQSLTVATELKEHTINSEGDEVIAGIINGIEKYQTLKEEWQVLNTEINTVTNKNLNATIQQIVDEANSTVEFNKNKTSETITKINKMSDQAMTLIVITSVVGLIIGILLALILTRSIVKPVLFVTNGMDAIRKKVEGISDIMHNKLAHNDWSSELQMSSTRTDIKEKAEVYSQRSDEIGEAVQAQLQIGESVQKASEAINKVIFEVNHVLGEVVQTVQEVSKSSHHLESASQELADGASQQASSLEEITSSLQDMNHQVEQNAEGASKARDLSQEATTAGSTGNEKMTELVSKMDEINNATGEITKIIKTIDDIAFQTNLLALNAAVEAARAGQHGKGFAVVAEEVRNLAARSAKAAGETGTLIDNVVKQITIGNSMVGETASVLSEIVEYSEEATTLSSTVATASNEQSAGVSQINIALDQVDEITQRNAASAEETASSSQELNHYSSNLEQLTERFVLKDVSTTDYIDEAYDENDPAQIMLDEPTQLLEAPTPEDETHDSNWGIQ